MLTYLGIAAGAIVVTVLLLISRKPDSFRVARSLTMNAAPEVPFGFVNDFHRWTEWSPFEKLDTNLQRTYTGSPEGIGAGYAWSGNSRAGQGVMTITESVPARKVALDLFFEKPFKAQNLTVFSFTPTGNGTTVEWVMSGNSSFMHKTMSMVMDMDGFLGKAFDEGLENLKRVSEA